ncbi:MAG: asparagine synthase [Candidatus Omnitrophica bacterium]|nr:asparagine synthase [Candidatus Omnitrophota bacterium]
MMDAYVYTGTGHEIDQKAAWDYVRDGYLLSPRTILKGRKKLPQPVLPGISVDSSQLSFITQQTLEAAMGNVARSPRAVMFSGGFDSMLIACLAKRCGAQVTAVTVQFDDFNPLTVAGAAQFANKAGIPHHILNVKAVEFLSAFETLAGITDEPLLDLDLGVVYAALKKYDHGTAGDVFISGMGSDQWFGNLALEARPGGFAARLDWSMVDEQAHQRVAGLLGCRFVFPFLSGTMLALSQSVPAVMKKDKKLLRTLAAANTIPHRGARSEVQILPLMRRALIKKYGDRAWPCPVSLQGRHHSEMDRALRQIILGLWLEKAQGRIASIGQIR